MDLALSLADVNGTTGTFDVSVSDVSSGVYILVIHGVNVAEIQKAYILH